MALYVPVTLHFANGQQTVEFLVDTGATIISIAKTFFEQYNLPIISQVPVQGVFGRQWVPLVFVKLQIFDTITEVMCALLNENILGLNYLYENDLQLYVDFKTKIFELIKNNL